MAPAELEALLAGHPQITAAAVVGAPDEEAGELPTAFVVAGEGLDDAALMEWVAERVAPHKRIRRVERVEEIPCSPSGKILRRELRARPLAVRQEPPCLARSGDVNRPGLAHPGDQVE